ncbi:MAG TPA: nuclear transport factor 2 family protein, partial [Terrimicrobiaceae bacterium]
ALQDGMPHGILVTTMKRRLSLALASLATCIAVSAFGLSGDLAGNAGALEDLNTLSTKFDEAVRGQDAVALAALFTPDGVRVSPDGVFSGREAIEKSFADDFQRSPIIGYIFQTDQLHSIGEEAWSVGQWWKTLQGKPVFASGYWSAIIVREGGVWRFRMLTFNEGLRLGPSS